VSSHVHEYATEVRWSGSTADGYEAYTREHEASCPPAADVLRLSADPAFGGDPTRPNPEQLLVAAASSCQLLSFLAVAAHAGIDVREYRDFARGTMDAAQLPMRVARIELRPTIVVAPGPTEERVRQLFQRAHDYCFIANSLNAEVALEPEIEFAGA